MTEYAFNLVDREHAGAPEAEENLCRELALLPVHVDQGTAAEVAFTGGMLDAQGMPLDRTTAHDRPQRGGDTVVSDAHDERGAGRERIGRPLGELDEVEE